MEHYANKPMADLAKELCAGLLRLRKGYLEAAEALLQILQDDREYPHEFVVFRLTGFRPRRIIVAEPYNAPDLRKDLLSLMLEISASFELATTDYAQSTYDSEQLAARFKVSTKTIQRWRLRGLPARWLIFPDGKRRVGFLESSIAWFVRDRQQHVLRSMRFSQMSQAQRDDIIRRARRMASFTRCTLSEIARRLASRTGRAVETVRYTIRRHDAADPKQAVFPYLSAALDDNQKEIIYRCFLRGVQVPKLATNYRRTRGSIYRIINEMRARQLLRRPVSLIYNTQFDSPDADQQFLGGSLPKLDRKAKSSEAVRRPEDLPPYLRSLYEVPLLDVDRERELFARYNYLKHKADKLRRAIDVNHIRTSQLRQIEMLLLQANAVKNELIRANLRLVVSIAKKHLGGPQELFELISDGNVSLMRAVEKFDFSRGYRFSTYASWAIMRNFARSVPQERFVLDRFATGQEEALDIAAGLQTYDPNEINPSELRESIDVVLAQLSPRERTVLIDHYGLDNKHPAKTLDQLGQNMGLSKERVRQIEIAALQKLRRILYPQQSELMR